MNDFAIAAAILGIFLCLALLARSIRLYPRAKCYGDLTSEYLSSSPDPLTRPHDQDSDKRPRSPSVPRAHPFSEIAGRLSQ